MRKVCKNCFSDSELKAFIVAYNDIGQCDFCHSDDIEIVKIDELLDFFNELFENFQSDEQGKSIINILQNNWNLFTNSATGDQILQYLFKQLNTPFTSPTCLADYNNDIKENFNYWYSLKTQLKNEKRYFTNIEFLTQDLGWDSFFESKVDITPDDVFYRARLHRTEGTDAFSAKEMYCPPRHVSTAGRANPLGIPYLYLCDNTETVLYEVRAAYLDEVSIGTFKLKSDITGRIIISDFTEKPTIFYPNEVNKRIKSTLLKQVISKDLSKPMRRYDSELDYIPTQFICEFIKIFTNVQGIKFRSSLHQQGNNIVIFDQNIMDCINVQKVHVSNVLIESAYDLF